MTFVTTHCHLGHDKITYDTPLTLSNHIVRVKVSKSVFVQNIDGIVQHQDCRKNPKLIIVVLNVKAFLGLLMYKCIFGLNNTLIKIYISLCL